MKFTRRTWLVQAASLAAGVAAGHASVEGGREPTRLPAFRVSPEGWGIAKPEDVKAVLRSAAAELWQYFPGRTIEPFVVSRGHSGPIVHYRRNSLGEIVMHLDTCDRYWCQYAYQFSHEFCHILCGFDDDWKGNNWFEETLCETASLFVLRRMTRTWQHTPPRRNWRTYAPRFAAYAQSVMQSRPVTGMDSLGSFLRRHEDRLRRNPSDRTLNGAMAAVLLPILEGNPADWEAVAWLNSRRSPQGQSFAACLHQWLQAVPPHRRPFVRMLMNQFEIRGS